MSAFLDSKTLADLLGDDRDSVLEALEGGCEGR